ncbi:MAG: hypothetical protein GY913_08510 [Proteobacteria bacterium]|nr:hypothetical protein [Pseudomonadota bacterium]
MAWWITVGGALLGLGLCLVPLPGLEVDLAYIEGSLWRALMGGVLAAAWLPFLVGRLLARWTGWRRTLLAATSLAAAGATLAHLSVWMEFVPTRSALLACSSAAAATALLWWLSDRLSERGALGGTLTVYGGPLLIGLPSVAMAQGASIASGGSAGAFGVSAFALLLPLPLGLVLWRRLRPDRPPLLPVKHPSELLLLPLVAWQLLPEAWLSLTGIWPPEGLDGLVAVLVAIAVIVVTRSRARGPAFVAAWGLALSMVAGLGMAWGAWSVQDVLQARYVEGPLAGDQDVRVLCLAPGADRAEADRMRARLDALRIPADVQLLADTVQLELDGIGDPDAILPALTSSGRFEVRGELTGPTELDNDHIRSATMGLDAMGMPSVTVDLTDAGHERFLELSTRRTGSLIHILLDGEVLLAPYVVEPISGGRLFITLETDATLADAQLLATVLDNPPLSVEWVVTDVQTR